MSGLGPLGRRVPPNFEHVAKYPISALPPAELPTKVPVAIGVNWYTAFDSPEAVTFGSLTRYFVGRSGKLGTVRGGHCVCVKAGTLSDPLSWWDFYNQGQEGACVGFGSSRMMSLLNRKRYDARWLWDIAKAVDPWPDTNPGDDGGTSVHAAMDVLRTKGHVPWLAAYKGKTWTERDLEVAVPAEGIAANRWATTVDEMRTVLASPLNDQLQAFPFLNSWGRGYPHITWIPYTVMARLLSEEGEAALVTDR